MTPAPISPARTTTRIAVTSGKGGVGKTSLAINLSVALGRLGHRVGLLDADFGLGNVDVMLGLTPHAHIGTVLSGEGTIDDVALAGPGGVRVIPAGSGVRALTALDARQWRRLSDAMRQSLEDLDFLLVDTASGISDNVLDVVALTDYVIVVTSYEPAAVVDAYAVVKLITAADRKKEIGIVVNSARDEAEAERVFRQIALAAERFLGRELRYDGFVALDPDMRDAALDQAPIVSREQTTPAGRCFRRLAQRLASARPSGGGPWPTVRPTVRATPPSVHPAPEAPRCA